MNDLEKAILKTIAFFDVFSYPLTASELWKWLYKPQQKYSLADLRETLATSQILKDKLDSKEGFYHIKGRDSIYLKRKQRNNLAERKFRKVIYLAKVYRFIPFVRMVAVCNSLGYSNAGEKSDIDLFIISRRGTIWLARFFTILIVKFLHMRPREDSKKDTFCLSFFVDEKYLNIESSQMNKDDIYYPYWLTNLIPVYNPDGLYEKFLEENHWYKNYLPNAYPNQFAKEVYSSLLSKISNIIIAFIFNPPFIRRFVYNFYRMIQIKIIDKNLKTLINIDTRVIVNEQMLKFYSNDNRELFAKQWRERVHVLINKN
ncbi:MAG: hypothetical protein WCS88_01975 [Patescibacteria group bacterium]|jgi:hypothetical protein